MRVLGIDSATKTGWALVDVVGARERLISSGTVDGTNWEAVGGIADQMGSMDVSPTLAVIEDTFAGRGDKMNIGTVKVLANTVGRWLQALEPYGIDCMVIQPNAWQSSMLRGFAAGNAPRDERKRAAQMVAKAILGVALSTDEADAVLMALWAARKGAN